MKEGQGQLSFLLALLGALCGGIYAADQSGIALELWALLAAGLFLLCCFLLFRSSTRTWVVFVLLFFVLGALRMAWSLLLPTTDISYWAGEEIMVYGTVTEPPRSLEDGEQGLRLRYLLEVEGIYKENQALPASGHIYVYARQRAGQAAPAVQIGDRLQAAGKVRRLHGYGNPGRVDSVQSARARGITAQLSAGKSGVKAEPQERLLWLRRLEAVRAQYLASMEQVMPKSDAAAIFAMLFGGYEGIRPELLEAFTTTGIVHILSVSGSHITLLAASVAWLGGLLRLRQTVTALLVALAIVLYSLLAGCVPPVIRSGIMGLLAFLALVLERDRDARRVLLLTGIGMLLFSPLLLYDISFQLSFAATAGLLAMGPVLRERLQRLPELVRGSLAITVSAQLFTLPLLAWYFHVVSLSSLLANLIAVPIVEFMIVLGLLAGLLSFVLPAAGRLIFLADSLLLGIVYELTRWMARLPGSQVWLPAMGAGSSALYYALLGLWLQPAELRRRLWRWCCQRRRVLSLSLLGLLFFAAGWQLMRPAELAVHFIDVGQGDAALIITPHGRAFMIDCGGTRDNAFDVGGRVDVPYLLHYGVHELDAIFLTHAHEDHAAGAGGIVKRLPVHQVFIGSEGREAYTKSMGISLAHPVLQRFVPLQEGEQLTLDGVEIEVLYAPPSAGKSTGGNEVSNVLRVCYGQASFLFTGDLISEQEQVLLQRTNPRSMVLKVGHHGSKTSTSPAFLQAAAPRWSVISVGADNSFGHPNAEIIERLTASGSQIYRTDRDGAIVFHTDGEHMRAERYRE